MPWCGAVRCGAVQCAMCRCAGSVQRAVCRVQAVALLHQSVLVHTVQPVPCSIVAAGVLAMVPATTLKRMLGRSVGWVFEAEYGCCAGG